MRIFENSENPSFIHGLDPRVRIAASFAFAVLVCLCERLGTLSAALGLAFVAVALSRIAPQRVARRLAEVNLLMLILALFLPPFLPGETAFGTSFFLPIRSRPTSPGLAARKC